MQCNACFGQSHCADERILQTIADKISMRKTLHDEYTALVRRIEAVHGGRGRLTKEAALYAREIGRFEHMFLDLHRECTHDTTLEVCACRSLALHVTACTQTRMMEEDGEESDGESLRRTVSCLDSHPVDTSLFSERSVSYTAKSYAPAMSTLHERSSALSSRMLARYTSPRRTAPHAHLRRRFQTMKSNGSLRSNDDQPGVCGSCMSSQAQLCSSKAQHTAAQDLARSRLQSISELITITSQRRYVCPAPCHHMCSSCAA